MTQDEEAIMSSKDTGTVSQQNRSNESRKGFFASIRRMTSTKVTASDRAALRSFARLGLLATSAL